MVREMVINLVDKLSSQLPIEEAKELEFAQLAMQAKGSIRPLMFEQLRVQSTLVNTMTEAICEMMCALYGEPH